MIMKRTDHPHKSVVPHPIFGRREGTINIFFVWMGVLMLRWTPFTWTRCSGPWLPRGSASARLRQTSIFRREVTSIDDFVCLSVRYLPENPSLCASLWANYCRKKMVVVALSRKRTGSQKDNRRMSKGLQKDKLFARKDSSDDNLSFQGLQKGK